NSQLGSPGAQGSEAGGGNARRRVACVDLDDRRVSAYVTSVLQMLKVDVRSGSWSPESDADLLVLSSSNGYGRDLEKFLQHSTSHHAVVFGAVTLAENDRIHCVEAKAAPSMIRQVLQRAIAGQRTPSGPVEARR